MCRRTADHTPTHAREGEETAELAGIEEGDFKVTQQKPVCLV